MNSIPIRCLIHSALCHIEAKIFINYFAVFAFLFDLQFWPIGLGHISASRPTGHFPRYVDQVGCVLASVAVGRSRLIWIPGSRHSRHARKDRRSLSFRRLSFPQILTLSEGIRFIAWCLIRTFYRGMPTGLKAFLELLCMCGLRSCA